MSFPEEMKRFASGHWTLEQPTKPGRYAAQAREVRGTKFVDVWDYDGETFRSPPWEAWFWSEPMPRFPDNPDVVAERRVDQ